MPIKPIDAVTKRAIGDILLLFHEDNQTGDDSFNKFLSKVYAKYNVNAMDAGRFKSFLSNNLDIRMRDNFHYLQLELTKDKKILPLVTMHSTEEWVHFRIYTLLTTLDENLDIQALSIRYETDEGDAQRKMDGSHDFCHAQLCNSISHRICATTPKWLPESQPSIPLDANDQISLVLCMLTSLYGGKQVRRRINDSGIRNVGKYLNKVRALSDRTIDT